MERRILIRADASARIGAGHIMRCLGLADALARRGAEIVFVSAMVSQSLADCIREAGHRLLMIPLCDADIDAQDWDRAPAFAADQHADAEYCRAALGSWTPDWIILDHYRLGFEWERRWRGAAGRILVLDDLANRSHECALLLDQTFGRSAEDYRSLTPAGCRILTGPRYALLRLEFSDARAASLRRRRVAGRVGTLLISLGATDVGGVTARVLRAAIDAGIDCRIDVVLGRDAPSRREAEQLAADHPQIALYFDSRDMAGLMTRADLAIGAAGATSWERCCLGLPSVLLPLAENQQLVARNLDAVGAARLAERWEDAVPAALSLLSDPRARAKMSAAAAAITSGKGAESVASIMTEEAAAAEGVFILRPATATDSEEVWLWRNDPTVRELSKTRDSIAWQDHAAWFARALMSDTTELLIGETESGPKGIVRFDRLSQGRALVSIAVAPANRGSGVGSRLLAEGCRAYTGRHPDVALTAEILEGNIASERIFAACGFEFAGASETAGFRLYIRPPG